jgi:hypothetical protein
MANRQVGLGNSGTLFAKNCEPQMGELAAEQVHAQSDARPKLEDKMKLRRYMQGM